MPPTERGLITPAQVSFLTIYNPSLSRSDETLSDQIVFYYSQHEDAARLEDARANSKEEEKNERLRQIGLAQGMVAFARNFSGHDIDTVEAERGRLILKELELGWWILVSIDFTRIANSAKPPSAAFAKPSIEYSSREVSPADLLLQQLLKAHSIFLLHHGASLTELYQRTPRDLFCFLLNRFWTNFIWNWDVLLHGNPAIDLFNGLKVCGSGELGFGVGEEEWGSGERDVLEDFVSRTDGLIDIVASRFGEPRQADSEDRKTHQNPVATSPREDWLGQNAIPSSTDGVFFSGVKAVAKQSVIQISRWMEWIYRFGEDAYGVRRDPLRRRHGSKPGTSHKEDHKARRTVSQNLRDSHASRSLSPGIPPPLIAVTEPITSSSAPDKQSQANEHNVLPPRGRQPSLPDALNFSADALMKVLTLGYGSAWGQSSALGELHETPDAVTEPAKSLSQERIATTRDDNDGYFILGFRGDLSIEQDGDNQAEHRILLRRLIVSMASVDATQHELTAVVYVRRPFMFTFLFELRSEALKSSSLYRGIDHQLRPLWKSLLASTSPRKFADHARIFNLRANDDQPLYDVIFDKKTQIVHSNIPSIPDSGVPFTDMGQMTRLDALNIHTQILQTYIDTRGVTMESERSIKTNRGWWILWLRLGRQANSENDDHEVKPHPYTKEAFLVRKAVDNASGSLALRSTRMLREMGGSGAWSSPIKLAEIGLDARRYVESLLDFNR